MKYICLAYGEEKDWVTMSKEDQVEMLAADEVWELHRAGVHFAVESGCCVQRSKNGH